MAKSLPLIVVLALLAFQHWIPTSLMPAWLDLGELPITTAASAIVTLNLLKEP